MSFGMWWHLKENNGSLSFSKRPEPEPGLLVSTQLALRCLIANILLSSNEIRRLG